MFAPLLALSMMQTASTPDRGAVLFHNCQALIRESDSATGLDTDRTLGQRCLDYTNGFADGMAAGALACFGKATRETLVRVYVNFVQAHPTYMDEYEGVGFYVAMLQSYPCPKK